MQVYDEAVLQCFLENQGKLFPEEDVASSLEEAEAFLEELLEADEVFDVGDGRYLIVEG